MTEIYYKGEILNTLSDCRKLQRIAKELDITPRNVRRIVLLREIKKVLNNVNDGESSTNHALIVCNGPRITSSKAKKFVKTMNPGLYKSVSDLLKTYTIPDLRLQPDTKVYKDSMSTWNVWKQVYEEMCKFGNYLENDDNINIGVDY